MTRRTISWFSCGAASAVATKLALAKGPVTIAYCEVAEYSEEEWKILIGACDVYLAELL